MAAAFPPKYMGAVMFGNGISGFGTIVLRGITLLIWPAKDSDDPHDSNAFTAVLALYIFAFCILALCTLAQIALNKNEYA